MFRAIASRIGTAAMRLPVTSHVPFVTARTVNRMVQPVVASQSRFMSGTLINGKEISEKVVAEVKEGVAAKAAKFGRPPGLATVLVGARDDSKTYVGMKMKRAAECGFKSFHKELASNVSQEDLMSVVRELNEDPDVDGILVQLPLPEHIDQREVLLAIDVDKDVDGFHPTNAGQLARSGEELRKEGRAFLTHEASNAACTPLGCIELLDRMGVDLNEKHAVVLGRSNIVGLPVALMLLHRNATVSICHSRTTDIAEKCAEADVVIAALGQPEMVRGNWIKEGAVVIDVGINFVQDKSKPKGRRLCGDVKFDEAAEKASMITPVPGGVGPMTVAMLMRNTYTNWVKAHKSK